MQTDALYVPGPREKPLFTAEPLTLDDLLLLSNLFYLPYEHGPIALNMLEELHWLKNNNPVEIVQGASSKSEKVSLLYQNRTSRVYANQSYFWNRNVSSWQMSYMQGLMVSYVAS